MSVRLPLAAAHTCLPLRASVRGEVVPPSSCIRAFPRAVAVGSCVPAFPASLSLIHISEPTRLALI
eukprot:791493-Alexandrium_andersonii.AAC.1